MESLVKTPKYGIKEDITYFASYRREGRLVFGRFNNYAFKHFKYNQPSETNFKDLYDKIFEFYDKVTDRNMGKDISPAIVLNPLAKNLIKKANGVDFKSVNFKKTVIDSMGNKNEINYKEDIQEYYKSTFDLTKYNLYCNRKKKDFQTRPHFGFIDIDIKLESSIEFYHDYKFNKFSKYKEAKADFYEELAKLPEVIMYGSSSGGHGIRIIFAYDYDIFYKKEEREEYFSLTTLGSDLHKTGVTLFMQKLQDLFNIRMSSSYQDLSTQRITQTTFMFGKNDKDVIDVKLKDYTPLYFEYKFDKNRYMFKSNEKEFDEEIIHEHPDDIIEFKSYFDRGLFVKGEKGFMTAFHNYMKYNLSTYNIGKHNVVLAMIGNINDDEISELFWKAHKKYYDEAHKGGSGALDYQLANLKNYKVLCKESLRKTIQDEYNPLSIYSFVHGEKYLGMKTKNTKLDNIGL